jgi:hypothetical protein
MKLSLLQHFAIAGVGFFIVIVIASLMRNESIGVLGIGELIIYIAIALINYKRIKK